MRGNRMGKYKLHRRRPRRGVGKNEYNLEDSTQKRTRTLMCSIRARTCRYIHVCTFYIYIYIYVYIRNIIIYVFERGRCGVGDIEYCGKYRRERNVRNHYISMWKKKTTTCWSPHDAPRRDPSANASKRIQFIDRAYMILLYRLVINIQVRRPSVFSRTRNCTWKITIYYIICTVHASCKYFCAKTRNFDENKTVHVSMRVGFQKPKRKLPKRGSATNRPGVKLCDSFYFLREMRLKSILLSIRRNE